MSLADVPIESPCRVTGSYLGPELRRFSFAGLNRGVVARVLARYRGSRSAYAEVEMEGGHRVTVPLRLAASIHVEPLPHEGVPS